MMLNTQFTINLSEPIKPGKVTIGYFDGVHPSIVAVTRSDKIFVHNPHNRSIYDPVDQQTGTKNISTIQMTQNISSTVNDLNFLNINQTISCIAAGSISSISLMEKDPSDGSDGNKKNNSSNKKSLIYKNQLNNDILIVGTKTSVHVYDILHNTDLYYKEIPDGANALVIGEFGQTSKGKLALIGGNCAIHGFDRDGLDAYWMVTGDNITAMALVDIDNDLQNELVVGSEDCEIQVFKKDAIIAELCETDRITHLCPLGSQLFAYALANGTVGVYQNKERVWRIKSKNQAMTLFGADINNDGQIELLTGWSNGKLDIRIAMTGEVLYRENYKCSVAGIMISDYNMDGLKELIVCTVAGDVYGYHLENQEQLYQTVNFNIEQDTIRDLMKKKQTLLQELRNYEENSRIQNLADPLVMSKGKVLTEKGDHFGAIPANTKLKSSLILQSCDNTLPNLIKLRLETTNNTKIRAAIIFAEGIFKHESIVIYPSEQEVNNIIIVPLRPPKDVPVDMHVKALVGYHSSSHYHVFELSRRLPRFSMYSLIKADYLNKNDKVEEKHQQECPYKINEYQDYETNTHKEDNALVEYDFINYNTKDNSKKYEVNMPKKQLIQLEVHQPDSYVIIKINEQIGNIVEWVIANFLFDFQMENDEEERRFEFRSLRDQSPLIIEIKRNDSNVLIRKDNQLSSSTISTNYFLETDLSKEHSLFDFEENKDRTNNIVDTYDSFNEIQLKNIISIYSESIEVAGNCIQSIGDHFKITDLPCYKANFPDEIKKLKQLVNRVEEIQSVRQHLIAEVADNANMIRAAVVQAEDARLIEEYQQMKQIYNDLTMLNKDIMREYKIRCQNHQDLVDSLKQINIIIQRASNLRIGSYKTAFINSCREAIKHKNFAQLFKIINED